MYILLCGYPPFNGDDDKQIIENVKNGTLEFCGNFFSLNFFARKNEINSKNLDEDWSGISEGAKTLIRKMLKRNPRNRVSA
jgi:calcium-dependent protein kinase